MNASKTLIASIVAATVFGTVGFVSAQTAIADLGDAPRITTAPSGGNTATSPSVSPSHATPRRSPTDSRR